MITPLDVVRRAEQYLQLRHIAAMGELGGGKDGTVVRTSRLTALKVHRYSESYLAERDAYRRLLDQHIRELAGFTIPLMLDHDDDLLAIEMEIVFPPFIVDFASAYLDTLPDFIEDEGHTFADMIEGRFGDRAPEVLALYESLAARAGIYLLDLHSQNIKFRE